MLTPRPKQRKKRGISGGEEGYNKVASAMERRSTGDGSCCYQSSTSLMSRPVEPLN